MFEPIKLPYEKNVFEPLISAETFDFHYEKHYKTYLNNLNSLLKEKEIANQDLEKIIQGTYHKPDMQAVFNNAAQVYNHEFFFNNLQPISNTLKVRIIKEFDSLDHFKKLWKKAALAQFGSGWVWLVENYGKLDIIKTPNAETPIAQCIVPLLCLDVWEHAYYIDYRNVRADFIDAFLNVVLI